MAAKVLILAASLGAIMTVPMLAHHSFGSEYDEKKPLKFENVTVTKLEWTNPHAHIHLDVAGRDGAVTSWKVELGTPNDLMRGGWSKTSVKPGDRITVNGYPAKDGSRLVNARSVTMSDGRLLFARPTVSRR